MCRMSEGGPLVAVGGHSRWVWRARHNPLHDSLLLTSSADCTVGLHYLPGIRRPPPPLPLSARAPHSLC